VLIPGAIKTMKSQCTESQRNKTVLSSRLNSVRQMSCCRSPTGRLFVP